MEKYCIEFYDERTNRTFDIILGIEGKIKEAEIKNVGIAYCSEKRDVKEENIRINKL